MNETCKLLFVYGTLRRDSAHPMARYLESVSRFLGPATIAGRLYDFGWHPVLVAASRAEERVHGHLVELLDHEAVLKSLDQYEADPPGFERRLTEVTDRDGRMHPVWTYFFTGPLGAAQLIASGDFGVRA
jgi:gamma-glutamylcyclotransferase (GGCT)/AIG2-like uncharacterized protein YtfP